MIVLIYIAIFFILLLLSIVFSTLSLRVEKLSVSNYNLVGKLEYDFLIYLELYFLGALKIFRFKIDKQKIEKLELEERVKKLDFEEIKDRLPSTHNLKKMVKKLNINLDKIQLYLKIGSIDPLITSAIVAVISAVLGIVFSKFIKKYDENKYKYEILPLYQDKNQIKLNLNCIIKVKMVHIISIIYIYLKKGRGKNYERTSNRRSYDYSYE